MFESLATNLVVGDTNGKRDIFVHDRQTGVTERVSVASDGTEANDESFYRSISADGRYVGFGSWATNLVAGDSNGVQDIFVHERQIGVTERASVASDGTEANGPSYCPFISDDGRYVAFTSHATNLVAGDGNGACDVFVRDRQTGVTERVSVTSDGREANGESSVSCISGNGRYVAFESRAFNLVVGDTNGLPDIFVHDRQTGVTERVSVASDGTQANGESYYLSISGDGCYVAFQSLATNLVVGDINGVQDIFVHDRLTGQTELVSVTSDGQQANGDSSVPSISADGRHVAFHSRATNLVPGGTHNLGDVYVRDRLTGRTEQVSVASDGAQGNPASEDPSISANGQYVAFDSSATNLVAGDTNNSSDIFVRDQGWTGFPDVPPGFWAYDEIMACYYANTVKGCNDGLYHPTDAVTRDQMSVYISRAHAGGDENVPTGPAQAAFEDVPDTHWAYKYVEYAVSHDVVQGYDATHYVPDAAVDRGQMAAFVARAKGWVGIDDDMTTAPDLFPDVPTGFWAGTAIQACVENGVVQGYEDGHYRPEWTVTRDQMAVYVARAFQFP
jgi:Tol biopolymer transport system component